METMSEEQRVLIEQLIEAKIGAVSARAKGIPDTVVRDVWAEFEREALFPSGRPSLRSDVDVCMGHKDFILDLVFGDRAKVCLGNMPLSAINGDVGEAWRKQLQITERKVYDTKVKRWVFPRELDEEARKKLPVAKGEDAYYGPTYINRIHATLMGFLTWKVGKANNPLRGMGLLKYDDDVRGGCYFFDEEELEDFLAHAHPTLKDMARLSVTSGGMRNGEVRNLRVEWVQLEARKIVLPKGWATKNRKGREFPIGPREIEMLTWRKAHAESIGSPLMYPNPHDPQHGVIPSGTVEAWMQEARRDWGKLLNGVHPPIFHSFRHTWATWAGLKGMDAITLMRQGGWTSYKIAMRYTQQGQGMMDQTTALLSRSVRDVIREKREIVAANHQAKRAQRG